MTMMVLKNSVRMPSEASDDLKISYNDYDVKKESKSMRMPSEASDD